MAGGGQSNEQRANLDIHVPLIVFAAVAGYIFYQTFRSARLPWIVWSYRFVVAAVFLATVWTAFRALRHRRSSRSTLVSAPITGSESRAGSAWPLIASTIALVICASFFGYKEPLRFSPQPAARATPYDAEVISAALADLLADKDALIFRNTPEKTQILLNPETNGEVYEPQLEADLDSEKWKLSSDMQADLKRRNSAAASLEGLAFASHVVVQETKEISMELFSPEEEKFPKAKGYAGAYLPGYSKDGKQAVVRFWFGPTPHGATATYLLIEVKGKWIVKERAFAFYA